MIILIITLYLSLVTLIFVSGTPPECKDCKEEVNCSEGKGVHASFGEGPVGVSGGGGDEEGEGGAEEGEEGGEVGGGGGKVGGGDEPCAYECKSTGGCSVRYTGPPRAGPTIGDHNHNVYITYFIMATKVLASPLHLEAPAVELQLSVATATKSGRHH